MLFPKRRINLEKKYDLRIIRTYKSLTEAFLQLMSEKHFEDITINELCERAMIRRTTFYKHFADKYEFFRFFVWRLQTDFDAINPASADFKDSQSFYISILQHLIIFFKEHEKFVQNTLNSNLLPTLLDILSEQIASDIEEKLKTGIKNGINIPAAPDVTAAFFTGALLYTVKWWLMQKKQLSVEKLIQEVEKLLFALH
jgi:AcrR family transcriptional regulator